VTDINDLLVIMVRRDGSTSGVACEKNQQKDKNQQSSLKQKISCHVLQASNVCVRHCCNVIAIDLHVNYLGSDFGIGHRTSLQRGISRISKE